MSKSLFFVAGASAKGPVDGSLEFVEVSAVAPRVAFFSDRESAWVQASARCLHVFRCEVDDAGALVPGSIWAAVPNPECEVKASVVFLLFLHELISSVRSSLEKGGVQCV